jgi:hypothetical protein
LAEQGIPLESLREALNAIEPLRLAHRVAADRTWLYTGTHDTVVPPDCSLAWKRSARLPEEHHIELPADHYSGIIFLPGVIQQMVDLVAP